MKTTLAYDAKDRVATRTDPLLHPETFAYNLNDNLTSHTDRKGQVTKYSYDALNRMTFIKSGTGAMYANYQQGTGSGLAITHHFMQSSPHDATFKT